jgi:DNA topoisomerase-2
MTDKTYKQISPYDHIITRPDMYGGQPELITKKYWYCDTDFNIKFGDLKISALAFKLFDEILVNASDEIRNLSNKRNAKIKINHDEKTNVFSITNTGSCIPLRDKETIDGKHMKLPQFLFGELNTSSNYNKNDDTKNVNGGMNGIGAKLTNIFSTLFTVETCDGKTKYTQTWRDRMSVVEEPIITSVNNNIPYVKITFDILWDAVDMKDNPDALSNYVSVCRARAVQSNLQTGCVFWNNYDINKKYRGIGNFISRFLGNCPVVDVGNVSSRFDWNVSFGIKKNSNPKLMTVINGVHVRDGGSHINYIKTQIANALRDKYEKLYKKITGNDMAKRGETDRKERKKFKSDMITKYLFIVCIGSINNVKMDNQTKDSVSMPVKTFSDYKIPERVYDEIWRNIEGDLKISIKSKKLAKQQAIAKPKGKVVKAKKYLPATNTLKRRRKGTISDCRLILVEGDSAFTPIKNMISARGCPVNNETHGIFSVQGVILNVRQKVSIQWVNGEKKEVKTSPMFDNSERIISLLNIIGLDYTKTYKTKADLAKLNYSKIIIATDQDEDGKGNIRGLIINLFQTLFPGLVRLKFIQFLTTPLIRVYPKSNRLPVAEFFDESSYEDWWDSLDEKKKGKYKNPQYYKGLGSHSNVEVKHMATQWNRCVYTVMYDKLCEEVCDVYFGKNASKRKFVLKNPVIREACEFYVGQKIAMTNQFNSDTKSFQSMNVVRHIPSLYDGFPPSKRKAVYGSIKYFAGNKSNIKVYQLMGNITAKMCYHHGGESLNGILIRLAAQYVGARVFPILRALGNFGTRYGGGSDAGQPRYIGTNINNRLTDLLYPSKDMYILDYNFDDNVRVEPIVFIPIVPTAILESLKSVGHGWASTVWARDYKAVSKHLHKCINAGGWVEVKHDFPIYDWGLDHKFENMFSIGKYQANYEGDPDTILITELPLDMWNITLKEGSASFRSKSSKAQQAEAKKKAERKSDKIPKGLSLDTNEYVELVLDSSNDDGGIHIKIKFVKGTVAKIKADYSENSHGFDPIIEYLELYTHIHDNLTFVKPNGTVVEYNYYWEIFRDWFKVRRGLYVERHQRELTIYHLHKLLLKNKIRFAENRSDYNLNDIEEEEQVKILDENKYVRLDHNLILNPGYTPISELKEIVLNGDKSNFDYLILMNSRDISKKSILSMKDRLKKIKNNIKMLANRGPMAAWKDELTKLDAIMDKVQTNPKRWNSWDTEYKFN